MFDVPVALIVFNRPELTARAVQSLREIKPKRLFVIADGPRYQRFEEAQRVRETRSIIETVDWPCDLVRIYSDSNLGCGTRPHTGITEAFSHVEDLIILEDDCVPHLSFFEFTKALLHQYRANRRVMAISGNCFLDPIPGIFPSQSHYFSKYMHCWGWATWRRAWNLFDASQDVWNRFKKMEHFSDWLDGPNECNYWENEFAKVANGRINQWDYNWLVSCWMNQGLTALPTKNLVSNVGFGELATHTKTANRFTNLPTFPLCNAAVPTPVERNCQADRETDRLIFSGSYRAPTRLKVFSQMLRQRCRSMFQRTSA